MTTTTLINFDEIERSLNLLYLPDQVFEVRVLDGSFDGRYPQTLAGFFQNTPASKKILYQELAKLKSFFGVYTTIQQCHPDLIHRVYEVLKPQKKGHSTPDEHVTRYRWLPIDCDPVRISHISTRNDEHDQALAIGKQIVEYLSSLGFPDPVIADSGNGAHLLYALDLPNTDEIANKDTGLIARVLAALAQRFDTETIKVDTSVFNPARIWKLYGSRACKGSDTRERPHRMATLLAVPQSRRVVSHQLLEAIALPVAATSPVVTPALTKKDTKTTDSVSFVENFLQKHSLASQPKESTETGFIWRLEACPWNSEHTDGDAAITVKNDKIGFHCFHASCADKDWKKLRLFYEPDASTTNKPEPTKKTKTEENQEALTRLLRISEQAKYICTPDKRLYARVPLHGHYEIVPISEQGSGFKRWLVYTYKQQFGIAPNAESVSLVMSGVVADAEYAGEKTDVYTRIAEKNGCVYLDLADDQWRCIEISKDGYRVISCPPVYFIRSNGMLPLPMPRPGGSLMHDLKKLINARDEKDYILMAAWLLGTLHPKGPYPVLNLTGERGSAKSKGTTILRNLIDPSKAPTRGAFKDFREAAIAAQNNMIIGLDNLSKMPDWLSDALCRIATGSGHTERALYENSSEIVFNNRRAVIMNGIEDIVTAPDLIDRALMVSLEPPDEYISEKDIDQRFNDLHPTLLGSLLQAASHALKSLSSVKLKTSTRMMDFAEWITAAEPALGWSSGSFMDVYLENKSKAAIIATDSSSLAKTLTQFFEKNGEWEGLTSELLDKLQQYETFTNNKYAPKTANKLSGAIKRLAPALRSQGMDIQQRRTMQGAKISFKKFENVRLFPAKNHDDNHDDNMTIDCKYDDKHDDKQSIVIPANPDQTNNQRIYDDNDDKRAHSFSFYPQALKEKNNKRERENIVEKNIENLSSLSSLRHEPPLNSSVDTTLQESKTPKKRRVVI